MGQQISRSVRLRAGGRGRGVGALTLALMALFGLSGCSAEDKYQLGHWAMPDADATKQSVHIYTLWKWAWIALLIVGVIVWFLMFYAAWRYRRRNHDDLPVQTRYNLPLEIFYTIAPMIMIIVLFYHTVETQNAVLEEERDPDHVINVVGQQWQWTFNYTDEDAVSANNVYTVGTATDIPTLYLPVGETTQFYLTSPDVIHSFWITGFLFKLDVIPGQENHFQVTPTKEGSYRGKCAELCGTYHSRMIFNVEVVSPEEFDQHLQELEEQGFTSEEPLTGGVHISTPAGSDETGGHE